MSKVYFSTGHWTPSCIPMKFQDFPNISLFPGTLSLKSYYVLSHSSTCDVTRIYKLLYKVFVYRAFILDIKFRFTCGEWKLF